MLPDSYADKSGVLKAVVVLIAAMFAGACATGGGVPRPRPFPGAALPPTAESPADPAPTPADTARTSPADAGRTFTVREPLAAIISTALSFRGIPYRNGGSDPTGFDCSGFVQYVYAMHSTGLPRDVHNQYRIGRDVERKDVKPGDLVFFKTHGSKVSHVGIYAGSNRFVHAPMTGRPIELRAMDDKYYSRRFAGGGRVVDGDAEPAPGDAFTSSVGTSRREIAP